MTGHSGRHASTAVSQTIMAQRCAVYLACLDPVALAAWRAPDDMTAQVHAFDAREGGAFRISLTYQDPKRSPGGKTAGGTDTYHGRFVELIPCEKIVEAIEFEAQDPRFAGAMTITTTFIDTGQATEVTILCKNLPVGVRREDNELGSRQALRKLAALVERGCDTRIEPTPAAPYAGLDEIHGD